MKFKLTPYNHGVPDDELIADLKKLAVALRKTVITREECARHGKYSEGTLRKRFGGWRGALSLARLKPSRYSLTRDEMVAELQRIASITNKNTVSVDDLRRFSEVTNQTTICRRFGTWSKALQKAGLQDSAHGRRHTEDDYLENLLNVWVHFGRQPTAGEIDRAPSKITRNAYAKRFGTWRMALELFVERMNANNPSPVANAHSSEETAQTDGQARQNDVPAKRLTRNINLRMRFLVFRRDNFKCRACGRSPATDHSVILHVDHMVPWSKGGPTTLDNLQTLCSNCNLGKSDVV